MCNPRRAPIYNEVQEWTSDLEVEIRATMQQFSDFPSRFNYMMSNNRIVFLYINFDNQSKEIRDQYLNLQDDHRVFEHHLRPMKYKLAIKKYEVQEGKAINPSIQRALSENAIKHVEDIIQDYLLANLHTLCVSHPNQDLEEGDIIIKSEETVTTFKNPKRLEDTFIRNTISFRLIF
ncbi:hypothetical protein BDA99DRAFT_539118 [Phascolomyces articulosus]|uniref:Uncharacterized protein n=1 Tax=Phascolomyces articulosus TaxID=60185 RepID=A0AAD5KA09_9FUNG|nr:hypothetical protein BDA99DRAFT_539118 [Phascolomyces articulosus]